MSGSKKLYHFCAGFCVDSIKELGLILGICPVDLGDKVKFIPKCQWLTSNPDPQKQSWATSHTLNYSRTAYRLTVVIPRNHRKHYSCEDCPFYAEKNNRDTTCGLRQTNPAFWRIKRNCVIRLLEDE